MIERDHLVRSLTEPATSATSYADISSPSTDLICREDSYGMFIGECRSRRSSPDWMEEGAKEFIIELIEGERDFVATDSYTSSFFSSSLNASAREDSIAWMFKIQKYHGFRSLTIYLSVNYMDRFLCSSRLQQIEGWPIHLLSVTCLSLAAKMEEPFVPSLTDFQIISAEFIFEPKTISRMELLVLGVLGWRLRSVTPFNFLDFFAWKLDPTGTFVDFIISRASEIILANLREFKCLEHPPSSIAAAAILCASGEIPELARFTPEQARSWSDGLCEEKINNCYQFLENLIAVNCPYKNSKVYPPLQGSDSSSSSSSFMSCKRRKLNGCSLTDEKESSEYDNSSGL